MTPAKRADIKAGAAGQLNVLPAFSYPKASVLFCDADRASLGVFRRVGDRLMCEHAAAVALPTIRTEAGAPLSAELEGALRSLRSEAAGREPLVLLLPSHLSLLKHLRLPRVDARKRARLVAFEAAQKLPCPLTEVVWDTALAGGEATAQELVLAAVRTTVLLPWCEAVVAAGFRLQQVVPFPLALLAGCRRAHRFSAEPTLVLHIGLRATTLLLADASRFAVRNWLLAPEVDRIVNAEKLAQEIVRSVLHLRAQSGLGDPRLLLLAGETAVRHCDTDLLASRLEMSVRTMNLAAGYEAAATTMSIRAGEEAVGAELAGAAAMRLFKGQAAMNLLPDGLRTKQRRRGRKPWLVTSAALMLAAPVLPWLQFRATARAAESRAAEIERVITPWRALSLENRSRLDELNRLRQQIVLWEDLHARRTSWLRLCADWQHRFAALDGVWIDRLQVLTGGSGMPMRLSVEGRMLASSEAGYPDAAGWSERARGLLRALEASPFVSRIANERFDASHPGWLGFELVLETGREDPL